jgi:hypothetical protein
LDTAGFLGFFSLDELHIFSNFSKLFFSMLSSNYNERYKNEEDDQGNTNKDKFPFELSAADLQLIKESIDASTEDVTTGFNSTWKGLNYNNSRAIFRSIDWTEAFLHSVPTIISPKFKDKETTIAVNALARGCLIASQWEITEHEIIELEG